MSSNFLDNPKLFRHLVENLPAGIYVVDQERRIRFWNHGAERLTGHLSHEVVGHLLEDAVQICDRRGNALQGESCPVTRTLSQRQPQQCNAFYLHKNGHRTAMRIRTQLILEYGDANVCATVLFEEAFVQREESSGPPLYGCLDANTGIPSRQLTRAVLNECMAGMEKSHAGFGLLRIRLRGLQEFSAQHGPQSIAPFLRTAAHTLRNSLDAENFLGCWEANEFLAVLSSASPLMVAMTADVLWNLLRHSEILWWGDRFLIETQVSYTVATPGKDLESLLHEMTPTTAKNEGKARAASTPGNSADQSG
jgi:PAS domain S-box-containing protein